MFPRSTQARAASWSWSRWSQICRERSPDGSAPGTGGSWAGRGRGSGRSGAAAPGAGRGPGPGPARPLEPAAPAPTTRARRPAPGAPLRAVPGSAGADRAARRARESAAGAVRGPGEGRRPGRGGRTPSGLASASRRSSPRASVDRTARRLRLGPGPARRATRPRRLGGSHSALAQQTVASPARSRRGVQRRPSRARGPAFLVVEGGVQRQEPRLQLAQPARGRARLDRPAPRLILERRGSRLASGGDRGIADRGSTRLLRPAPSFRACRARRAPGFGPACRAVVLAADERLEVEPGRLDPGLERPRGRGRGRNRPTGRAAGRPRRAGSPGRSRHPARGQAR